jgi:RNA polymerase sigma factor (sigma-70 family)
VNSHAGAVLDQLDRLFNRGTIAGLSEGALLDRYVSVGDEAAFAALVARHGPMVLGVCRRVLRDERDVEDAFQATFLVLVRRAGAIRDGDLVGRWLHGVAHRVAVRARAHSARRFVHEQSVSEPIEAVGHGRDSDEAERRELSAIVDEEVTRLPSPLRAPVVLCYLEGMSHDEAARRLRWPVGTVRSRMARARDVLRRRLDRRGVTADGAALAKTLVRPPVPPEWLDATVRGSLHFATHPATAAATIASARSVAIARRILQTMIITKLSCIGAVGLGIVLALGGVRTLAFQGQGEPKPIGLAAATAQNSGGPLAAPKEAMPPDSRPNDRIDAMSSYLSRIEAELKRSTETVNEMREQLRKVRGELDAIARDQQPAPARPAASTPTPSRPAGEGKDDGDWEVPRYAYLSRSAKIMVVSPDGARIANYDPASGESMPLVLPAIRGIRRELIVMDRNPFALGSRRKAGVEIDKVDGYMFLALDLDRDRKVTRIGAFHALEGNWFAQDLPEPVDRSSVAMLEGAGVLGIGRRIYYLTFPAKRWAVLESPPGKTARLFFHEGTQWAECDGRLYRLNYSTGVWDDIYARALEDKPAKAPR